MFGRKKKKSFFEKITGGINLEDFEDDEFEDDDFEVTHRDLHHSNHGSTTERRIHIDTEPEHMIQNEVIEEPEDAQLAVDVVNNADEIVVTTMVAGIKPSDVDIDIARDAITIRGSRREEQSSVADNYFCQELYWGSFSRTIELPDEVDVDLATAKEKHGVLTVRLPKIDKHKKTKLRVGGH